MIFLTHIVNLSNATILCSSAEDDSNPAFTLQKKQAKALIQNLSTSRDDLSDHCTLKGSGDYCLHYLIQNNILFLTFTESSFSAKLALLFLKEVANSFFSKYSQSDIDNANRAYSMIVFDHSVNKIKREYQDARSAANLDRLQSEVNETHRIMIKNMEEVIGRDERLNAVSNMASQMAQESQQWKKTAEDINIAMIWRTYGPVMAVGGAVILVVLFRYLFF